MVPVMSVLWGQAASAGTKPIPLRITTSAGTFEVDGRRAVPPARLDRSERTCAIALEWSPSGVEAEILDCPEGVASGVVSAVEGWRVSAPAGASGRHLLAELWFVYPFESEGAPRVLVRQSHDRILSLPEGIDAVPFAISAWSFVRYPRAAHRDGVPDVSCTVRIRTDGRGHPAEVGIDGCGDPYREAARSAISSWRFEPLVLDGAPIPTALTLKATFVSEAPLEPERFEPSEESLRLWTERQFTALSQSERIRFIEAALLGDSGPDLGPGQVRIALPSSPDLGGREPPSFTLASPGRPEIRPVPDHPPLLVIGREDHPAIRAFELSLPSEATVQGRCPVLVQVDGEGRVFSWAEEDCDPSVRSLALDTADGWLLRHDGPQTQATRVRFRATLVFAADGQSRVVFAGDDLRTPQSELPPGVRTRRDPKPIERLPPRLPRDLPLPDAVCTIEVTVSAAGRPKDLRIASCPPGFEEASLRAVRRWRWRPAEDDGVPIESRTEVSIRFRP